jgi:tRNA (guanine37-N1)-methyltransferase
MNHKRSIAFVTIHPGVIEAYRAFGVIKSAESQGLADIMPIDLRDFAADKHGSVDDSPYGGGDGMIMRPDCLGEALDFIREKKLSGEKPIVIYTSPAGRPWNQNAAQKLANLPSPLVFICGRFGGIDQRFIDQCVDEQFSIGDVVLAGGELPALMMSESILRLVPGVLGHDQSADDDSFGVGMEGRLEYPSYTRPPDWRGHKVPDVLLSGNHEAIQKWRRNESIVITRKLRPDLIRSDD